MASTSPETAASNEASSSTARRWKDDVFLSYKSGDIPNGFILQLYDRLQQRKITTFVDHYSDFQVGDAISPSLRKAIEESKVAVVVLSQNYASSAWCLEELTKLCQFRENGFTILPVFYKVEASDVRKQKWSSQDAYLEESRFAIIVLSENYAYSAWCLDEITKIFQCMEGKDTILPIFYHVNPSDVQYQKKSYEAAFKMHSRITRYDIKKVKQWRADLTKVGNISGWDTKNYRSERELVEDIVKVVLKEVLQTPREDFEEFEATREAMDEVKRMLKDDNITVIGVYKRRCWQDSHGAKCELVNQLGLELVEDGEVERASRLRERIMGGKKILIILDDIWEIIDLSSIGIPSYDELQRCNSKVLLTTRIRSLCHSRGCQEPIPLKILSEDDSLKFFMKKTRKPFHGSADSDDEERKIVRECAGLPSLLEEAAREFGDKYVKEWNEAVSKEFGDNEDELQKSAQEVNASKLVPTKDEKDTFRRIELCYHTLRFDDAKSFFLLCCMFPEDYDIPFEKLLTYGIGKAMSILLSEEGHAFFVKGGCDLKYWPVDGHEAYSAISLMGNNLIKLPETLVCSELQILLLQNNAGISDIPENFFRSPNALRVFDISYTSISALPSSFNLLTNLQALHLDCCNRITDISVLGKLKKVEILSLRKFPHKDFPKEIGNLTSLRILDVTGGCVQKLPSTVISRLYRLEELYMKCEFGEWGSEVEEAVGETNADFDEIVGLSRLNILKVYISDAACLPKDTGNFGLNWVNFDICISRDLSLEMMLAPNDEASKTLTLDRTINGLPDWFINVVTEKAEKLVHRDCKGVNNIVKEYEHGRLHGLKHVAVIGCLENLEELKNVTTWDPSKVVF
ncbi:hypothetical protein ACLB2K_027458 [Fragaria x ananassa]